MLLVSRLSRSIRTPPPLRCLRFFPVKSSPPPSEEGGGGRWRRRRIHRFEIRRAVSFSFRVAIEFREFILKSARTSSASRAQRPVYARTLQALYIIIIFRSSRGRVSYRACCLFSLKFCALEWPTVMEWCHGVRSCLLSRVLLFPRRPTIGATRFQRGAKTRKLPTGR